MRPALAVLLAAVLLAGGWFVSRKGREYESTAVEYAKELEQEEAGHEHARKELEPRVARLEARLETQAADMKQLREERRAALAEAARLEAEVTKRAREFKQRVALERVHELASERYGSLTVKGLERVRELDLSGTNANDRDLTMLTGAGIFDLGKLEALDLSGTQVTQAWVEAFQAANPDVSVRGPGGK